MKNQITIKPNPSIQKRDRKIIEISFFNSSGEYKGLLMSLKFFNEKPVINLYRIDKDIDISVSEERETY
jgi:hypothetical protein